MKIEINLRVLQLVINEMAANDYEAREFMRELPALSVDQLLLAIKTLLKAHEAEDVIAQIVLPSPKDCRAILAERAALPIVD